MTPKQVFVLRNETIKDNAKVYIGALPLEPVSEVIIRPHKKDRTVAQNSLMWLWITHMAGETGETKDEVHKRLKKQHLIYIYERDDPEYAAMVKAIRDVYKSGMKAEAQQLIDHIADLTSTTKATVEQFTEYLNDIDQGALSAGIVLPKPEDRYPIAMGLK